MHKWSFFTLVSLLLSSSVLANVESAADSGAHVSTESTESSASATKLHEADTETLSPPPTPAASSENSAAMDCSPCVEAQVSPPACDDNTPGAVDAAQLATAQMMVGVLSALVAVPSAYLIGGALGSLSPNLLAAGLPALAVAAVLPPLAVAGASWLYGTWLVGDPGSFGWALAATSVTHLVAMAGGVLLKVSSTQTESLLLLSAAESLLLPVAATTALSLTRDDGDQP